MSEWITSDMLGHAKPNDRQVGGNHYKEMPIQPWDVMETILSHSEFVGFLKGNYIKYAMRAGRKLGADAAQDAGKAEHYRQKLREIECKEV
jgi:hypothetical protein